MVLEFSLYLRFMTLSHHEMINTFIIIIRSERLLETACDQNVGTSTVGIVRDCCLKSGQLFVLITQKTMRNARFQFHDSGISLLASFKWALRYFDGNNPF